MLVNFCIYQRWQKRVIKIKDKRNQENQGKETDLYKIQLTVCSFFIISCFFFFFHNLIYISFFRFFVFLKKKKTRSRQFFKVHFLEAKKITSIFVFFFWFYSTGRQHRFSAFFLLSFLRTS
jgi:hypothetical protein